MNGTPRLSVSGIEYLDLMWSPYSGCRNWQNGVCGGGGQQFHCWAMSIVRRFGKNYPNGFEPTWYEEALLSPLSVKKPAIIGVGWIGDMFGDWVNPMMKVEGTLPSGKASIRMSLKSWIHCTIEQCPQHRFLFLTKCPWNLPKWAFPSNAWVGVTAVDHLSFASAYYWLARIKCGLKWISIEPLLNWDSKTTRAMMYQSKDAGVGWLVIGAATRPYKPPPVDWVEELVWAAAKVGIAVWLKNNLAPALPQAIPFYIPPVDVEPYFREMEFKMHYRQEMP